MEQQYSRIIKLAPSTTSVEVLDFNDAFGEHSEARGKKKRAKKKRDGSRFRKAAIMAATGGIVGGLIKTGPQARAERQAKKMDRIKMRGERSAARMANRAARQEKRQTRKDIRKTRKVERKAIGAEYEDPEIEDQNTTSEPEAEYQESEQEQEYSEEEEAPTEEDGYAEEGAEEEGYAEEGTQEEDAFDGGAEGTGPEIHSEIRGVTQKIVWNKEHARRQNIQAKKIDSNAAKLAKTHRDNRNLGALKAKKDAHIMVAQKHEERAAQLQKQLSTKFPDNPQIAEGMRQATVKLQKQTEGNASVKNKAKIKETIVQPNINAEFSHNRIDVPPQPFIRTVELSSRADGSDESESDFSGISVNGMSTTTKWLLGIAAVGIAIVVAKKYKVI